MTPEKDRLATIRGLVWDNRARMPSFVIYDHPKDFPDHFVARLWWGLPECVGTAFTIRSTEIDTLRDLMESAGLVKLSPNEGDDPIILETWL